MGVIRRPSSFTLHVKNSKLFDLLNVCLMISKVRKRKCHDIYVELSNYKLKELRLLNKIKEIK